MRLALLPYLLIILLLALAACSQEAAEPGTAIPAVATEAEVAQQAPLPSQTPTPTALPTETPLPTSTPTITPTPTATAVLLLSAADFGENRNLLTGELVDDPAVLQRRPIAVKISNAPARWVRPQSGLGQADLVFEHVTEASLTRFTAVIYDEMPPDMGPIRSGRLIDLEIPLMYDAAFAYSGSSIGVAGRLFSSTFVPRILRPSVPGYYRTGADKPYEHTLYADPSRWREELEERGENGAPNFANYMAFSEEPPAGGEAASHLNIDYNGATVVDWRYDEESDRYLRWADGEEHVDENTGEQLSAANVIVVSAVHQLNYDICEGLYNGVCTAYSMEIHIWGEGPALILRDGQQYEATWKRDSPEQMLTFYDAQGDPLPLAIGNSWFQMVSLAEPNMVTVEP